MSACVGAPCAQLRGVLIPSSTRHCPHPKRRSAGSHAPPRRSLRRYAAALPGALSTSPLQIFDPQRVSLWVQVARNTCSLAIQTFHSRFGFEVLGQSADLCAPPSCSGEFPTQQNSQPTLQHLACFSMHPCKGGTDRIIDYCCAMLWRRSMLDALVRATAMSPN